MNSMAFIEDTLYHLIMLQRLFATLLHTFSVVMYAVQTSWYVAMFGLHFGCGLFLIISPFSAFYDTILEHV